MPTKAPDELKPAGRKLWRAVLRDFELGEHEKAVLLEAARTVDVTLGAVLKYREDQEKVRQQGGIADIVKQAFERGALRS